MIVIPDDPEKEHLFLFNGLYQAFEVSKWRSGFEHVLRFLFYLNCIKYLSCQAQEKLPLHVEGVTSNDGLFKEVEFRQALIEKIYEISDNLDKALDRMAGGTTSDQALDLYISINLP